MERLYPGTPAGCRDAGSPLMAYDCGGEPTDCSGDPAHARVGGRLHAALTEPVRYLVGAGGGRWRPGLMMAVIEVLGGDSEHFGPLVASMELAHTGSLMVDDVEDGASLRRGRATVHTAFGTSTALNAGTFAYFTLDRAVRLTVPEDLVLRARLYDAYLAALRAAHAGQALDIQGHRTEMDQAVRTEDAEPALEAVRLTHRLKSGAMVGAGLEAAALVCGVDDRQRTALVAFGSAIGTAYQITDDVADLEGVVRDGVVTKQVGEDLHNGKVTMPLAHAVARLPRRRLAPLWHAVRDGRADRTTVLGAAAELRDCGALEACVREAQSLVAETWSRLEPMLPQVPGTRMLLDMARHVVQVNRIA
ncbi:hypothetical protein A6A06_22560 [Streptomyces sp. CB02923]|nr:hypothetical protein A6A06_22560 [Streptomyces sp. CB02923]